MPASPRCARRRSRPFVVALAAAAVFVLAPVPAVAEEGEETVVGELVQAWAEPATEEEAAEDVHSEPLSWIETSTGEAVRVPTEQVEDLPVGATVEVTVGDEVADEASQETGLEAAREVLATEVVAPAPDAEAETAPATAPLTNQVTVVMVTPAGGVQDSRTLAQVVNAVNGPVAQFWAEESQGAINLGVTASHDWRTTTAGCSDPTGLWNEVAGQVGFTSGPGKHLLVYVTSTPSGLTGCSYGLAQVGSGPTSGGRLYVRDTVTSLIAHEFGHNFRLGHASGRQCDGTVETGTCRTDAYRDTYDVMGISWQQVGSLNTAHAQLLGFLPSAQSQTVQGPTAGGQFTLAPLAGRTGVRGIRLIDADGFTYWLEYRTATGRDGWLGAAGTNPYGLQPGVLLRRSAPSPDTSLLLDPTPSASAGWNADMQTALPVGVDVPVSGGDFWVTVESQSTSGATVQIRAGNRKPVGALDPLTVTGSTLDVSGWAVDPDTPGSPIGVHLYVDGRGVPLLAASTRSEALAVADAGDAHGFAWSTQLSPGSHSVCAYAMDTTAGSTLLGCRAVAAAARAPTGALERFGIEGSTLEIEGWALDPDAPGTPPQVHIYVDGRGVPLVASGSAASSAVPTVTAAHGFSWSTPLSPGSHWACVYAIDTTGAQSNTVLGCQTLTVVANAPVGALERLVVSGSDITVGGWALDPDAPTTGIQVHIYVSGIGAVVHTGAPAVAGTPAALGQFGFTGTLSASRGRHQVCAYAIDLVGGPGNTLLGCRTVTV